jgi:hypothetical protein
LFAATVVTLVLSGCAKNDPGGRPTTTSKATGLVVTRDPTWVLDGKGGRPELCIAGVTDSGPAGCSGTAIRLTSWPAKAKRGVEYLVTGHLDGATLRVTSVHRWDEARDERRPDWGDCQNDYGTRCAPPRGGWRVLNPATTTAKQIDELEFEADELPGFTAFWWDFSRTPPGGRDNDPDFATANVLVDRDLAGARRALRQQWGGALCVTRSRHSRAEQERIVEDLDQLPGRIGTSEKWDSVDLLVVHDDGTLQRQVDERFGRGYVRITPALQKVAR